MCDYMISFAPNIVNAGGSLPMIGALLGYKNVSTTARYAHLAADPVKLVADRAAGVSPPRCPGNRGRISSNSHSRTGGRKPKSAMPAHSGEPLLRPADFPPGTPPLVVEFAVFYEPRAEPETRAVLRRLALDPRMPAIWRQLQRRRRDGGGREYFYQVRRENIRNYEPAVDRETDLALALLFGAAILSVRCRS